MEDSQDNSNLKEISKNSFFEFNFEEAQTQREDNSYEQNDESKSRHFYGDSSIQNSKSIVEKEINSTEKNNNFNGQSLGQTFNLDTEPIEKYSNVHFFCKKCHQVPTIKFVGILDISFTCECHKNKLTKIAQYLDETLQTIDINNEEENAKETNEQLNNILLDVFYCKIHKDQKFIYYCEMCNTSLCRKCLREDKAHNNHSILIFDMLMNEADEKIEFIKEKFYLNSQHFDNETSNFLDDNLDKLIKFANFTKFINALINDYNNYTCYSHFLIISNLFQFLENLIKNNNNDAQALELKEEIHINNINNLNLNNNKADLITSITLNNCNIFDIEIFCEANLINLKILNLRNIFNF